MLKYSIIIPVYNVEKELDECINSILVQTNSNYEIILIDDGSTDNSGQICDKYCKLYKNVCCIHQQNKGLSGARNEGIDNAKGEYVIFLDSDDYWDDIKALEKVEEIISKTNSDVLLFNHKKYFMSSGKLKKRKFKLVKNLNENYLNKKFMFQNLIGIGVWKASAWDKVVRTELLKKYEKLKFQLGLLNEDVLWTAWLMNYVETVTFLESDFYVYRQRSASISKNIKGKNIEDLLNSIQQIIDMSETENAQKIQTELYGYLAFEYANTFLAYTNLDLESRSLYKEKIEKYAYLLEYGMSVKVKIVNFLYKYFGFKGLYKSMKIFKRLKEK